MTTIEALDPRTLETGQRIAIDLGAGGIIRAEVEKVDKKRGGLKVKADQADGPTFVKFRELEEAGAMLALDDFEDEDGGVDPAVAASSTILRDPGKPENVGKRPKAAAPKEKAERSAPGKYPAEITEAVRLAKEIRGTTMGAPGAKQHQAVRKAITAALNAGRHGRGQEPTKKEVLDYLGMSEKALREAASGKMPTEKLRQQAGLELVRSNGLLQDPKIRPWVGGRNGCSILAAWVKQLGAKS